MEIIALSGYARSGKDEAAKVLVEEYGFTRVAFADKLREFLYRLDPQIGRPGEVARLGVIIDKYGWDGYKETPYKDEVRELLQRLGTECGRELLGENVWVDAALSVDAEKIVVADCRFPNEAEAVRTRGGRVWRVSRKGVGPINDHPSETSLDNYNFDAVVSNTGTLEEFRTLIQVAYLENWRFVGYTTKGSK